MELESSSGCVNYNPNEEKIISKKRENYTPEQKIVIVKRHMLDKGLAWNPCDQYGLDPTVFYR
jgi:hypothetical protein